MPLTKVNRIPPMGLKTVTQSGYAVGRQPMNIWVIVKLCETVGLPYTMLPRRIPGEQRHTTGNTSTGIDSVLPESQTFGKQSLPCGQLRITKSGHTLGFIGPGIPFLICEYQHNILGMVHGFIFPRSSTPQSSSLKIARIEVVANSSRVRSLQSRTKDKNDSKKKPPHVSDTKGLVLS